jgi:hypothetical protein
MGIFSRIFQRGQDGDPIDGGQEAQDSEQGEAPADGVPEEAEIEIEEREPTTPVQVPAASPALATAAAGSAPTPAATSSLFQTPLWSWPQRNSDTNVRRESSAAEEASTAPPPSAARQESPMAKPDDPGSPAPRSRSPLPGLPKRTPPAQPAATPPAATPPAAPAASPAPPPAGAAATPAKEKERSDATMVMSPPPAPPGQRVTVPMPTPRSSAAVRGSPTTPPAPAAAAPTPAPAKPPAQPPVQPPVQPPAPAAAATPEPPEPAEPAEPPRRGKPDTLTNALDEVVMEIQAEQAAAAAAPPPPPSPKHISYTPEDLAAVRGVFNDVAVAHVAQVRDVMLELRYGDADPKWIEMTRPALRSLRAMAAQMELTDLCEALDAFCAVADASVQNRARITDEDKAELQQRYARLI